MTKTAIVTGVTGQDGSHLAELLLDKGYDVTGIMRRSSVDTTGRIKGIIGRQGFKLVEGDITDVSSMMGILSAHEHVDEFYNLAAQSHVGTSFKQPAITWDITGKGVINILQSLVDLNMLTTRFYQASSSEMFGSSFDVAPDGTKYQDEETKFMPNSPYAIAKCAAHYAVRLFRDAYDLHGSCGILFNHEGPRRGDNFVTKKITNWIQSFQTWMRRMDLTERELDFSHPELIVLQANKSICFDKLHLGNLEAFRDWGYAGDYVEAMWLMLQQDYPDDYVVCTETTATIRDFLTLAREESGLETAYDKWVFIDPEFYRPSEVDYLRGSCAKARQKLGWEPKTDLRGLVRLMLEGDE